eukprot:CAMPEP_0119104728 /NCGR_PEP_ID=MMETSP1180-20130426/2873_1 /TAXON_ID=3052 ORGANISM="Chlamydomonas cf sp, Strain CCMP681" /NCGR_SAMPLE_ID=MMETSP1180 /ASSEMBLY_ACC=CAM_ASM_000741 /LENGTH=65 /DNA_ID=CAMNT_0007089561 /DNA_START=12 /DNA_END=206 /DNA_ORIENTATION=-
MACPLRVFLLGISLALAAFVAIFCTSTAEENQEEEQQLLMKGSKAQGRKPRTLLEWLTAAVLLVW